MPNHRPTKLFSNVFLQIAFSRSLSTNNDRVKCTPLCVSVRLIIRSWGVAAISARKCFDYQMQGNSSKFSPTPSKKQPAHTFRRTDASGFSMSWLKEADRKSHSCVYLICGGFRSVTAWSMAYSQQLT